MIISLALLLSSAALDLNPMTSDTIRHGSRFADGRRVPDDTARQPRPRSIQVSDWYHRRLAIHRALSVTTIPLFAVQYVAGSRLYEEGSSAPSWARTTHRVGATSLAGVFTVSTVTGLWNLWDSRMVSDKRGLRTAHAVMMLVADAAFTYTGVKLAEEAEQSPQKRRQHRTVALSATGLTLGSGILMKVFNK